MKMHMLNQDGSRLFSPMKIAGAIVLLGLGLVAAALLIVLAYVSVSQTIIQVYAPAPLVYDKRTYDQLPNLPSSVLWCQKGCGAWVP